MRGEDPATLFCVGAIQPERDRSPDVDAAERLQNPIGDLVDAVMPPKMFTKIDRTLRSELITSRAAAITSAFAPPPMSKKFAADPPTCVTTSSVLIARPAPFAMMPTFPERPM